MIDVYEVVKKLVGEISPVGETQTDNVRFENLKDMTDLVDKLLTDIDWIASNYKNNHSYSTYSMKRAAEYANEFYNRVGA